MPKELIVSSTSLETKLAILEDDQVTEIFIERKQSTGILGNVYKGKVTRVLPGMQAAFVDIGLDRNAFLYVTDFFEDYEEYEDYFDKDEPPEQALLNGSNGPNGRRSKKNRKTKKAASRRDTKSRKPGRPPKTPKSAKTDPAVMSESIPLSSAELPEAKILPQRLEFVSMVRKIEDAEGGKVFFDRVPILPDTFPLSVDIEASVPSSPTLANEEARSNGPDDLQRLVAPRGNGKARERKRGNTRGSEPLIGDLLKEGQEILVQVAKEPIGKKGARITSHIVFPGRYTVFMPTVDHVGVSRRIESVAERQRLRDMIQELRGDVARGFIVRTAGEGKKKEDFRQDMKYLTRLWEQVREKAEKQSAPILINSELDLVQRVVRDFFTNDFRAIRVDDEAEYTKLVEFISNFNPALVRKVRLYNGRRPIFDKFNVTSEIERALKSKVWLRNGGYIVINQTEALVAIDVNTGKYVGRTNSLEDTIAKTNLDAVKEVVRQIRLRDLGGIIVVDFIDMNESKNQQRVLEALQQEMRKDKSPSKILPFNEFGLVSITRKRVKQSLERTLCQPCSECDGTGMTKSLRTICYMIHQEVRRSVRSLGEGREIIVRCHPDVGRALRESDQIVVKEIEEVTGKEFTVRADPLMHIEQFDIVEE